jgi:hypothetical protein
MVKQVDQDYTKLFKRYVLNPTPFHGITADDIPEEMATYLPAVEDMSTTSPKIAFNLLMCISEHVYGDLESCFKSSGRSDAEEHYKKINFAMAEIISKRVAEEGRWLVGVDTNDIYESDIEGPCALYLKELDSNGRLNKSESNKAQKLRRADFKNSEEKTGVERTSGKLGW